MIYLFILFRFIYYIYVLHVMITLKVLYIGHNNTLRSAHAAVSVSCFSLILNWLRTHYIRTGSRENNGNIYNVSGMSYSCTRCSPPVPTYLREWRANKFGKWLYLIRIGIHTATVPWGGWLLTPITIRTPLSCATTHQSRHATFAFHPDCRFYECRTVYKFASRRARVATIIILLRTRTSRNIYFFSANAFPRVTSTQRI